MQKFSLEDSEWLHIKMLRKLTACLLPIKLYQLHKKSNYNEALVKLIYYIMALCRKIIPFIFVSEITLESARPHPN